jgi:hypothetical protein
MVELAAESAGLVEITDEKPKEKNREDCEL